MRTMPVPEFDKDVMILPPRARSIAIVDGAAGRPLPRRGRPHDDIRPTSLACSAAELDECVPLDPGVVRPSFARPIRPELRTTRALSHNYECDCPEQRHAAARGRRGRAARSPSSPGKTRGKLATWPLWQIRTATCQRGKNARLTTMRELFVNSDVRSLKTGVRWS